MPNIEVSGRDKDDWQAIINELRQIIAHYFQEELDDTVITLVSSTVVDLRMTSRPYLRVWHTDLEKAKKWQKFYLPTWKLKPFC